MLEIKEYTSPDGWNTADVGLSKEEWVDLLNNEEIVRPRQREWLLRFYNEQDHQSSFYLLGKKYNTDPHAINVSLTTCGRSVQKYVGRFSMSGDDDGNQFNHYISIIMRGKSGGKSGYQLMLRDEVIAALHDYLIKKLLEEFARRVIPVGLSHNGGIDELYKWEIITDCNRKDDSQILRRLIGTNLIDNRFDGAALKKLLESEPEDVTRCFSLLKGDPDGLQGRYNSFRQELDTLTGDRWQYKISDERLASAFLACSDPDHYTFYKNDAYNALCSYLRIAPVPARKKMCHFFSLLKDIEFYLQENQVLADFFAKETEGLVQSSLLNIQTIVWFMQDYMNQQLSLESEYTWVPFVKELAEKLLPYRSHRADLVDLFYGIDRELTRAYQEGGEDITDITPFTLIGTLAVGKKERRSQFASYYKEKFDIQAEIPSDYSGFPSLFPQRVMFIYGKNKAKYTEPFWELFDAALAGNDISSAFDRVMSIKGTNRNVSMGLFWIAPKQFLSLDSTNEEYLSQYGFPKFPRKNKITYEYYGKLMEDVKAKMESGEIKEKDFLELSTAAYAFAKEDVIDNDDMEYTFYDEITDALRDKKNIILQGAPGTGKTYAVPEIIVRLNEEEIDYSDRDAVMEAFQRLTSEKRVVFTTFHQSMDYEDFVEGLKPVIDEDDNVHYVVEDGIFKTICRDASKPIIRNNSIDLNPDAKIWKVSLEGTGDNETRRDCLKNGYIRVGFDDAGPLLDGNIGDVSGKLVLDALINKMEVGDIVMSCYSSRTVDAIGIVSGEYEWREQFKNYKRVRTVHWLVKGINEDIVAINGGKKLTLSTVYRLGKISIDNVITILKKYDAAGSTTTEKNTKPYVIVIDEINRGNVSKIFGELITLLEADKRSDGRMPLSVKLPYSKGKDEPDFSIPSNLYLIGTMNTADRSLAQFDYAMRRRFRFITLTYMPDLIKETPGYEFREDLFRKVSKLFIKNYDEYVHDVNVRVEPADCFSQEFNPADLWIGPSYFILKDSGEEKDLSVYNSIIYEIIPTLEQYIDDGVFVDLDAVNQVIDELKDIAFEPYK